MDLLAMMIRSSCVLCWLSPLLQGIISKQAKQRLDRRDSEQVLCVYRSASTRVCGSTVLCGAAVLPLRTTYEPNNTKKTCHGTYCLYTKRKGEEKRRQQIKNETRHNHALNGARRVPREQGCCLLVRSVVQLVDQQTDDTKRSDKKRTFQRNKELTHNGQSCVQLWWTKDDPKRPDKMTKCQKKNTKTHRVGRTGKKYSLCIIIRLCTWKNTNSFGLFEHVFVTNREVK